MERRTHEGPMDFEYQNGTGPIDGRSPFAQISMNQQRAAGDTEGTGKKRGSWMAFGSPSKPSIPSLRPPTSQQTHLFAQPAYGASSSASSSTTSFFNKNNPLFCTPRKLDADMASSGGETPKSPEHGGAGGADSDATPDYKPSMGLRSAAANRFEGAGVAMPVFKAGGVSRAAEEGGNVNNANDQVSPKKERRRDSWWSKAAGLVSSPGRGDVPRGVYSDKVVKKVRRQRSQKEKRQQQQLARRRHDDTIPSDSDDVVEISSPRKVSRSRRDVQGAEGNETETKKPAQQHFLFTFFEFLTTHPTLPHILSWYAQLCLNVFLFGSIMWVLWSFWSTIRSDVDKKSNEAVAELLAEMAVCAQQYTDNRCARDTRVPAMEVVCTNWEKCMNRDTKGVGRARVSAHTFAEIFNSFLEPISYKAMIFTLVLVFGCVALSNLPFSMFRDRAAAANAAANHHHYYGNGIPPPPTPQRQISGGDGMFWPPYHDQQQDHQQQMLGFEPAPSATYGQNDGQASPVRKLQFR